MSINNKSASLLLNLAQKQMRVVQENTLPHVVKVAGEVRRNADYKKQHFKEINSTTCRFVSFPASVHVRVSGSRCIGNLFLLVVLVTVDPG